ncbi:MAG: tetratricopeptide repeat protein [Candidatus Melainabacteria bacterium]|nr:tetratricopeptide repeat protein [Candidatus Melainabacteria bacterium]
MNRTILMAMSALSVFSLHPGALAQCSDNSGMVAAPQYGLTPAPQYGNIPAPQYGFVPAPQYGFVPAPQYGNIPAPQYGFVPAPQYGILPTQPFGQIPFGGLGMDVCPLPMPPSEIIIDNCLPELLSSPACPDVGTATPSSSGTPSGTVSRVTNLIPSLPTTTLLPSTKTTSEPGDLSSVIHDIFQQDMVQKTHQPTSSLKPGTIEYYSEQLRQDPNCAKCLYNRALVYSKGGHFDKAIADYNQAIVLNPNNDLYYYNRGIAYFALKQYPQALESYSQAIGLKKDCSRCLYRRSVVLSQLGKLDEALADCSQAIALDPHSAIYPYQRGNIDYLLGHYLDAIRDYSLAVSLKPDYAASYASRGTAYYAIGQYQMVVDDYSHVITMNPSSSEAYLNRATAFYELGQFTKAVEDFDRAIVLNPKCSRCYYKRCLTHLMLGHGDKAAADAAQVLALDGWRSPNALYLALYAYLGHMQAHQKVRAMQILHQAETNYGGIAWPYPILQYFLNKITLTQLLALATDNSKMTQAHAYVGLVSVYSSTPKIALAHLNWVKQQGISALPEYLLVLNQLKQMYPKGIVAATRPIRDKWALVIGISKFKDPAVTLKYADKDAKDFAEYLVTEGRFASDHVKVLLNEQATRENILAQLGDKWLPRVADPNDLVLIYVSTHGSPSKADIAGVNYVVAYNTDKDNLYATGLPIQDLTRMIKDRVSARRVVVFMDACHSGAADVDSKGLYRQLNFVADDIAQQSGQLVICSSQPDEISWESKRYPNGVFTHYLIEGLRQKGSNLKLREAYQYIKDKVGQEVQLDRGQAQTPVLKSASAGEELVLTAPPTKLGAAAH